jgi:hypothetical protein
MQYGSGMNFQRNHEEYIRQMQESLRRAQERSLYESVYSPSNNNQVGDGSASGSGGGGNPIQNNLPSNCIQFVVNTTQGTEFYFNFNSNGAINFTIDWGDGTTHEDSGAGGYYEESHTYPESDQQYTVRVCFDDPTIVMEIDFPGND